MELEILNVLRPIYLRTTAAFFDSAKALSFECCGRDLVNSARSFSNSFAT